MEPFAVHCPYCRAELADDIDNDPAVQASLNSAQQPAKRCPSCAMVVPLVRLSDGRITLAHPA